MEDCALVPSTKVWAVIIPNKAISSLYSFCLSHKTIIDKSAEDITLYWFNNGVASICINTSNWPTTQGFAHVSADPNTILGGGGGGGGGGEGEGEGGQDFIEKTQYWPHRERHKCGWQCEHKTLYDNIYFMTNLARTKWTQRRSTSESVLSMNRDWANGR